MQVRKIRNVCRIEEQAYTCTVEWFSQEEKIWKKIPYVVRADDNSPVNNWILAQLATGKYKIEDRRI